MSRGTSGIPQAGTGPLVALAVAASSAGLSNGFVQDDVVLIAQNTRLHDWSGWGTIFLTPFWPPPWSEDLYRPLTSLLLFAQYQLGAGSPLPFRITSIVLAVLLALAVHRLASRLLAPTAALAAAALFAVHPVHVEAVALAVAQNESLVALLSVLAVTRYLDDRRTERGAVRASSWGVIAAAFVAGSLLKEQGLILPLLLLTAEWGLVPTAQRWRGIWPGYTVLALLGSGALLLRASVLGEVGGSFTAEALAGLGAGARALTMLQVVPEWARLLLWPAHLQADYSPGEIVAATSVTPMALVGVLLLAMVAFALWGSRHREPAIAFGLAWTAVALLPVSNLLIPTGIVLAERTLLLPSVGAMLALGATLEAARGRLAPRGQQALMVVGAALVLLGVVRSVERFSVWRDEPTFALRGVADAPESYRMQRAAGQVFFDQQRTDEGLEAYQRALRSAPPAHQWGVRADLARRLWEAGADSLAMEWLEGSVAVSAQHPEAWEYLVWGYLTAGAYPAARMAADSAMARGMAPQVFQPLRALADTAIAEHIPRGAIRIRVVR